MQVERSPHIACLILLLGTLLGVMGLFGAVFWAPDAYLMHNAGDGLKAYYALEYFLRHQAGGLWHQGMQYPFGNHIFFVDMNPLLALVAYPINRMIPLADHTRALVNISMMLGFFPAAWAYWKLFREMALPHVWAIVGSWILVFLSPQIQRLTGHFSLSYVFFVPFCWLFILRMLAQPKRWRWPAGFALFLLLMGLMHPYYLLLGFGFLLSYLLVHGLQFRDRRHWPTYARLLGAALLPILLIKAIEWATTEGTYVAIPYGIAKYHAGFESVFLPMYDPFWSWWNTVLSIKRRDWEGYAYVGLPGLLFVFFWLGRLISLARRKQGLRIRRPVLPAPLRTAVWVGVILLIPAYAYPFQWQPDWVRWLGPLAQFRSTGRLAWIFYSVWMALNWWVIYALYRHWRRKGKALRAWSLCIGATISWALAIWSLGAGVQGQFLPNHLSQFPEQQAPLSPILEQQQIDVAEFQALMVLPFFHIGSEKFTLDAWQSERYGYRASLDTGLPLINSRSARASLDASLQTIQMVAHPLIAKDLLQSLPDQRPFLLLVGGDIDRPGEQALIAKGTRLGRWQEMELYRLPLSAFEAEKTDKRSAFGAIKDSLILLREGLLATAATEAVVQNSFGDAAFPLGGAVFEADEERIVYAGQLPAGTYEASCWFKIDAERAFFPIPKLLQYNQDAILQKNDFYPLRSVDIQHGWVRLRMPFTLLPQADHFEIQLSPGQIMDNLLIRPQLIDIYQFSATDSTIIYNNYVL